MFAIYAGYLIKATIIAGFNIILAAFLEPVSKAIDACEPIGLEQARAEFAKISRVIVDK
jgi:hypothetical protein